MNPENNDNDHVAIWLGALEARGGAEAEGMRLKAQAFSQYGEVHIPIHTFQYGEVQYSYSYFLIRRGPEYSLHILIHIPTQRGA